jgi:hypothetical protein
MAILAQLIGQVATTDPSTAVVHQETPTITQDVNVRPAQEQVLQSKVTELLAALGSRPKDEIG